WGACTPPTCGTCAARAAGACTGGYALTRQHRRGRDARVALDLVDQHPDLVLVAPAPVLAGLERVDQRVAGGPVMGRGVPVGRVVTAPDVAALQADPEVEPDVAVA